MWKPWIGPNFEATRLLLLGESAYDWRDDNEELVTPTECHCIELVREVVRDFEGRCRRKGGNSFMVKLSRALTAEEHPSQQRLQYVWDRVAFTNLVPQSIGEGARVRPSKGLRDAACIAFHGILENIKPDRVIVLGKEAWYMMPDTDLKIDPNMEAYKREDGKFTYCYALKHPSAGTGWQEIAALVYFTYGHILSDLGQY